MRANLGRGHPALSRPFLRLPARRQQYGISPLPISVSRRSGVSSHDFQVDAAGGDGHPSMHDRERVVL